MEKEKNIIKELWNFIELEKNKTKIAQKVYNWLNYDNLRGVMVFESGRFYFDLMGIYDKMPKYVYNYLKSWGKRKGLFYLYDD